MVPRAGLVPRREDADHQRVVVAVVRPLDLHDPVPTRERTHDPDRVERRLGPRVAEAPVREPVPRLELLRDDERVLGRLGEVRPELDATVDGLDDLRVRMTHHHDAVAVVVVDVLVPIDVPHVGPPTARDVDRMRRPRLPRRRHAARQVGLRLLAVREAPNVLLVERRDLTLRQLLDEREVDLDDVGPGAHGSACPRRSSRISGNEPTAIERWP